MHAFLQSLSVEGAACINNCSYILFVNLKMSLFVNLHWMLESFAYILPVHWVKYHHNAAHRPLFPNTEVLSHEQA